MTKKTFKLCAIDGDLLIYKAAFVAQHMYYDVYDSGELISTEDSFKKAKDFVNDLKEFYGQDCEDVSVEPRLEILDVSEAYHSIDLQLKAIKNKIKAERYKIYLTGKGNYREKLATILEYKGNRKSVAKPHWYQETKNYLVNKHKAIIVDGVEADDCASVAAYIGYKENPEDPTTVCASIDKDLLNTPGYHFNFDKDDEPVIITEFLGNYNFYCQLLAGDKSTDNIPGCEGLSKSFATRKGIRKGKGVGLKTAQALLQNCTSEKEMYDVCYECYHAWYSEQPTWKDNKYHYTKWDGTELSKTVEELIEEQAHLLWMQREKGVLWRKPSG